MSTAPALPPARTPGRYRIAVVCLGNICRSPMADVVLNARVADAGLADRVQVIFKGRLSAPLPIEAASEARLGLMMAGEDGDAPRAA